MTYDMRRLITLVESVLEGIAVDSPDFKQWFGRSKVVDRHGRPLRVYHGTSEQFERFAPGSHFGTTRAANQRVTFLGRDAAYVRPVYLRIENPLRVTDQEASDEATLLNAIIRGRYDEIDINTARRQGVYRALMDHGYDGLVYRNRMEDRGKLSWVIFHSDEVRNAI
jgi:hypothetical protein